MILHRTQTNSNNIGIGTYNNETNPMRGWQKGNFDNAENCNMSRSHDRFPFIISHGAMEITQQ